MIASESTVGHVIALVVITLTVCIAPITIIPYPLSVFFPSPIDFPKYMLSCMMIAVTGAIVYLMWN